MLEIEKNIPLPESSNYSKIIEMLEIGDSFLCPLSKRHLMAQYFKNANRKCKTAKVSDFEARVWRVQ